MKNSKLLRIFSALLCAALALSGAGCRRQVIKNDSSGPTVSGQVISNDSSAPASSTVSADLNGRHVDGVLEGTLSNVVTLPDRIEIVCDTGKITVAAESLLLNDAEIAKVPAAATKIKVTVKDGELTVTADGAPVVTGKKMK